jgi:hypothetical protein
MNNEQSNGSERAGPFEAEGASPPSSDERTAHVAPGTHEGGGEACRYITVCASSALSRVDRFPTGQHLHVASDAAGACLWFLSVLNAVDHGVAVGAV